jgi:zinc D-Ala-D-Ala carboxypeptidase
MLTTDRFQNIKKLQNGVISPGGKLDGAKKIGKVANVNSLVQNISATGVKGDSLSKAKMVGSVNNAIDFDRKPKVEKGSVSGEKAIQEAPKTRIEKEIAAYEAKQTELSKRDIPQNSKIVQDKFENSSNKYSFAEQSKTAGLRVTNRARYKESDIITAPTKKSSFVEIGQNPFLNNQVNDLVKGNDGAIAVGQSGTGRTGAIAVGGGSLKPPTQGALGVGQQNRNVENLVHGGTSTQFNTSYNPGQFQPNNQTRQYNPNQPQFASPNVQSRFINNGDTGSIQNLQQSGYQNQNNPNQPAPLVNPATQTQFSNQSNQQGLGLPGINNFVSFGRQNTTSPQPLGIGQSQTQTVKVGEQTATIDEPAQIGADFKDVIELTDNEFYNRILSETKITIGQSSKSVNEFSLVDLTFEFPADLIPRIEKTHLKVKIGESKEASTVEIRKDPTGEWYALPDVGKFERGSGDSSKSGRREIFLELSREPQNQKFSKGGSIVVNDLPNGFDINELDDRNWKIAQDRGEKYGSDALNTKYELYKKIAEELKFSSDSKKRFKSGEEIRVYFEIPKLDDKQSFPKTVRLILGEDYNRESIITINQDNQSNPLYYKYFADLGSVEYSDTNAKLQLRLVIPANITGRDKEYWDFKKLSSIEIAEDEKENLKEEGELAALVKAGTGGNLNLRKNQNQQAIGIGQKTRSDDVKSLNEALKTKLGRGAKGLSLGAGAAALANIRPIGNINNLSEIPKSRGYTSDTSPNTNSSRSYSGRKWSSPNPQTQSSSRGRTLNDLRNGNNSGSTKLPGSNNIVGFNRRGNETGNVVLDRNGNPVRDRNGNSIIPNRVPGITTSAIAAAISSQTDTTVSAIGIPGLDSTGGLINKSKNPINSSTSNSSNNQSESSSGKNEPNLDSGSGNNGNQPPNQPPRPPKRTGGNDDENNNENSNNSNNENNELPDNEDQQENTNPDLLSDQELQDLQNRVKSRITGLDELLNEAEDDPKNFFKYPNLPRGDDLQAILDGERDFTPEELKDVERYRDAQIKKGLDLAYKTNVKDYLKDLVDIAKGKVPTTPQVIKPETIQSDEDPLDPANAKKIKNRVNSFKRKLSDTSSQIAKRAAWKLFLANAWWILPTILALILMLAFVGGIIAIECDNGKSDVRTFKTVDTVIKGVEAIGTAASGDVLGGIGKALQAGIGTAEALVVYDSGLIRSDLNRFISKIPGCASPCQTQGVSSINNASGKVSFDDLACDSAKQFLSSFADAQMKWEGWKGGRGKANDVPNRCNNPGNINPTTAKLEKVKAKFGDDAYKLDQPECFSFANHHVWFKTPEAGIYYYQMFILDNFITPKSPYDKANTLYEWLDIYCPPINAKGQAECDANYKQNLTKGLSLGGKSITYSTTMKELQDVLNCKNQVATPGQANFSSDKFNQPTQLAKLETTKNELNENLSKLIGFPISYKTPEDNLKRPEMNSYNIPELDQRINEFNQIMGGRVVVEALNNQPKPVTDSSEKALREKIIGYYTKGEVLQIGQFTRDIDYISNGGADLNLVKYLDALYNAGIVWVSGPKNFGRGGNSHVNAMDFWGLGYKSDFNGDKIKGYTWDGVMTGSRGTGAVPSATGNDKDPRILRHVDVESPNSELAKKANDIFKKAVDLAYSVGAVDTETNSTAQIFANNTFAKNNTTKQQPIYNESVAKYHHHHLHLGIFQASKKAFGSSSLQFSGSGSSDQCCPDNSLTNNATTKNSITETVPKAGSENPSDANQDTDADPPDDTTTNTTIPTNPTPTTTDPNTSDNGGDAAGDTTPTTNTNNTGFLNLFRPIHASAVTVADVVEAGKKRGYTEELTINESDVVAVNDAPGGNGDAKLGTEAAAKWKEMVAAAKEKGINLGVFSGFRSVGTQTTIVQGKIDKGFTAEKILSASAPPGYSQHQTGRGVDINAIDTSFGTTPAYTWLTANALKYGYSNTYPKGNKAGADWEPWHWFYFKGYPGIDQTTGARTSGPKEAGATTGSGTSSNVVAGSCCPGQSGGGSTPGTVAGSGTPADLKDIKLPDNYSVLDESGKLVYGKDDNTPINPASAIKIIIAALVAKNNIDLNKQITMTEEMIYSNNEDQYESGTAYPVSDLITKMLTMSNNSAANALIIELGGLAGVNQKSKDVGLNSVDFKTLFDGSSTVVGTAGTGRYASTTDLSKAMQTVFSSTGNTAQAVQTAAKGDLTKFSYTGDIAHKHGNSSKAFANVAYVDFGGKKYFITAFYATDYAPFRQSEVDYLILKPGNPIDKFFEAIKVKLAEPKTTTPTPTTFINFLQPIKILAAESPDQILLTKVDPVANTTLTNEEKAFLDMIAVKEGLKYSNREGAGSAVNNGKYQIGNGDVPEALVAAKKAGYDTTGITVSNWLEKSEHQDIVAIGRVLRNAQNPPTSSNKKLGEIIKNSDGFTIALGNASQEFNALPKVPGFTHAGSVPDNGFTIDVATKYYQKMLAVYGGASAGNTSGVGGIDCTKSGGTASADGGFASIMQKISDKYSCGNTIKSSDIIGKSGVDWPTIDYRGNGTGCCYGAVTGGLKIAELSDPTSGWGKAYSVIKDKLNYNKAVDFHTSMQADGGGGKKLYEVAGLQFTKDPKSAPAGAIIVIGQGATVKSSAGDINVKVADGQFVNYAPMNWMNSVPANEVLGVYYPG